MTQAKHLRLVTPSSRKRSRITTAQWITIAVAILCVIGVIMVGSASSVISMTLYGSPWAIFIRELIWIIAGTVTFYLCTRIHYEAWRRWIPIVLFGTFGLLLIVMVPGLGVASGGSSRWIGYGLLRIQPSELMKLALALFIAHFLALKQEAGVPLKRLLGPLCCVTGAAVVLVVAQPDLGTAMVLMVILVSMLVAADVPKVVLAKGMGVVIVGVTVLAFAMPYRRARMTSFLNPWGHATTTGYQVVQSLIGLGSGHLVGLGLGNSREKWGLLPNAHTDFISSVIGEELGLVGIIAVLCILGFLISKGLRAAREAPDRFSAYLAVGLITWIGAEAIINIGAALDVLPVTGIPLPFISFGGSSLVITMAAAGILVNISKQSMSRPTRSASPKPRSSTASPTARKGTRPSPNKAPASKRASIASKPRSSATAASQRIGSSSRRPVQAPSTRQRKAR